jgi:hypothetical protein
MICRCVTESSLAGWIVIRRHDDGAGHGQVINIVQPVTVGAGNEGGPRT